MVPGLEKCTAYLLVSQRYCHSFAIISFALVVSNRFFTKWQHGPKTRNFCQPTTICNLPWLRFNRNSRMFGRVCKHKVSNDCLELIFCSCFCYAYMHGLNMPYLVAFLFFFLFEHFNFCLTVDFHKFIGREKVDLAGQPSLRPIFFLAKKTPIR